ncbi:MAG: hypothetical protein WCO45_04285 [Pseudanabaena sp. ELA607]|jgi:hypothetical protein
MFLRFPFWGCRGGDSSQGLIDNPKNEIELSASPRLKILVLESICAPCVQNLGQLANPNALGQNGGNGYNQTCPNPHQPSPRGGQSPLPPDNGMNQNWQRNAVTNTVDRAVRYSIHERPRVPLNQLPMGNSGLGR